MPRRSEAETGERRVWCRTNPCLTLAHLPNTITPTSRRGVASAYRREATPPHHPFLRLTKPRRNTLSYANKTRSSEVIKAVYSDILAHCRDMHPAFCARGHRCYFRFPRKPKRVVRAIDSTTIELISKCMDWAKHRKRKAAAKLHMSLDAASFLPVRIVPEPAKHHDSRFMVELCSGMKPGEIAVFDKAYVAYGHLHTLNERGIFRVTRAKDNACFDTKGEIRNGSRRNIISDDEVELHADKSRRLYPGRLRLIRARVRATDGTEKEMTFLTNNFEWAASTICDLYRCRWSIEWQLWSALTAYLLLRLYAWLCSWKRDFRHFFTLVKGALWCRRPLEEITPVLRESCGMAMP